MIAPQLPFALLAPQLEATARPLVAAGPDLGRYFVVCAVLVLLVGGLLVAFRKGLSATVRARAARRSLSVLDVLPLGGRQKVLVVRCYDRTFLLGAGDKELTTIAELDPSIGGEAVARTEPLPADRDAFARAFEKIRQSLPAPRLGPQVGRAPAAASSPVLTPAAAPAKPAAGQDGPPPAPAPSQPQAQPARAKAPTRPLLEGIVG